MLNRVQRAESSAESMVGRGSTACCHRRIPEGKIPKGDWRRLEW